MSLMKKKKEYVKKGKRSNLSGRGRSKSKHVSQSRDDVDSEADKERSDRRIDWSEKGEDDG